MTNPVSGLLSTNQMIADLQQRIPMGLSSTYCMSKLNYAYQWIEQQGAFTWNISRGAVVLSAGTAITDAPDDLDPGKPWSLYPHEAGEFEAVATEIPYCPVEDLALHQIYHLDPIPGVFSVVTMVNDSGNYRFRFAPIAATDVSNNHNFTVYYHKINPILLSPLTPGSATFPTPPAFDQSIVDIAEADIKRIYGLMGGDTALSKAQASAALLLDKYRSPKRDLAGLSEQSKEAQEHQITQQQVS